MTKNQVTEALYDQLEDHDFEGFSELSDTGETTLYEDTALIFDQTKLSIIFKNKKNSFPYDSITKLTVSKNETVITNKQGYKTRSVVVTLWLADKSKFNFTLESM